MNFASDNTAGVHPAILDAIRQANAGRAASYGADDVTKRLGLRFREIFETDLEIYPVPTGTAANVLALAAMTPPYGSIYCHEDAHVATDECGAPEFYTGGAKLVPLAGQGGKLDPEDLDRRLKSAGAGVQHHVQPAAVSLTQATEAGTSYAPRDIAKIAEVARRHGLGLHMDGARFANALVHLGCSAADMTWRAGIDILSFGATKNGALAAEAVVVFRKDLGTSLAYRRKRGGHLFSKMRFLSAQLEAYLAKDLWLANAKHANALAKRLGEGLGQVPGVRIVHPVEANEVFADLPEKAIAGLQGDGFVFHRWGTPTPTTVRLVTSFDGDAKHVEAFVDGARRYAAKAA